MLPLQSNNIPIKIATTTKRCKGEMKVTSYKITYLPRVPTGLNDNAHAAYSFLFHIY